MKCQILFSGKKISLTSADVAKRVVKESCLTKLTFYFNIRNCDYALRKRAYSNILKISPPKTESFQIKVLIFFIFLLKA